MNNISSLDILLVSIYLISTILLSIYMNKSPIQSVDSYFVSKRNSSWWLLGTSMVATTLSIDTPIVVIGWIYSPGLWKNWFWWSFLFTHCIIIFYFSRYWRRVGVLTDNELIEHRYSGKESLFLRYFKAFYFSIFFNLIISAWIISAFIKIFTVILGDISYALLFVSTMIAIFYTTLSGIRGVMLNDFIQYFIAFAGSIILAFAVINSEIIGGFSNYFQLVKDLPTDKTSFFPGLFNMDDFLTFLAYVSVVWWTSHNADGGGYIIDYLPAPVDVPPIQGVLPDGSEAVRPSDDNAPFSALAFKVMADPYGKLTFVRMYSGILEKGSYVLNSTKGEKERISRLVVLKADDREEVDALRAGDLGAVLGLKNTTTGDTLCTQDDPIVLETLFIPEPVISVAVEPKTKGDMEKLSKALVALAEEDPTFRVNTDSETGQTVIAGMGELHLEILVDRMLREFKVEANIGAPQVSYRETIRGSAGGEGKFSRQTGGKGQYGHVVIEMEPGEPGSGFEFVNKIVGGVVPKEYIKPAEQGMKETCESGVIAGYPLIDVKCTLVHGSYHDVDSSEMAFKIAGSMAFKDGVKKCNPVLLEPMMKVEVEAPEDFLGSIIGDLSSRRGQVEGQSVEDGTSKISAKVPLAEMFGYATELRSMTQGRGIFSMEFDNYAEVPRNVAEAIISKNQGNS